MEWRRLGDVFVKPIGDVLIQVNVDAKFPFCLHRVSSFSYTETVQTFVLFVSLYTIPALPLYREKFDFFDVHS